MTSSAHQQKIDELTTLFFSVFTNTNNAKPKFDLLQQLCIPEVVLINRTGAKNTVYSLSTFMEPRKKILSDGTLTEFEEKETTAQTTLLNNLAQRHSTYHKSGIHAGQPFSQKGHKLFLFVNTEQGWKISAVSWEDE